MGIYSLLLVISSFVFVILLCSMDPSRIHAWAFSIQMLWLTFWHLLIQYREYYLNEPVSIRLFLAVSSLMLLTQRITSVSMDLQENTSICVPNGKNQPQTSTQSTGVGMPKTDTGDIAGAVVLRIQYYSHWKISECLSNAAGLGFWKNSSGDSSDLSGLSDGDFWITESSSRISEFARRWNATTATWLRRLNYEIYPA
ncbi:hypothetical protein Q8A73_011567 [Channa argus]|nr:hypothetical protein Q8A73_011567 [Channa argus]